MKRKMEQGLTALSVLGFIGLTACLSPSQNEVTEKQLVGIGADSATPVHSEKIVNITSTSFDGATFIIRGSQLSYVGAGHIEQGASKISLNFSSKSDSEIRATLSSKLKIATDLLSRLVLSMASANQTTSTVAIPLNIELAPGSLSPSILAGTGVTEGAVLKWNGQAWVAAPDLVGVSDAITNCSGKVKFVGYTAEFDGNLGGIKGAHEKCHAAHPGSRWASSDELTTLGPEYPWTYGVWIWDSYGEVQDSNFTWNLSISRTYSCARWHSNLGYEASSVSEKKFGEYLRPDGVIHVSECSVKRRLACVK